MSDKKHFKWLTKQLPRWVDAGHIKNHQAAAIEQSYSTQYQNVGRAVFSGIGAVLFGCGVMLIFAYNWQDMHRFIKLLIILSSFVMSHLGAQWFSRESHENKSASEGLALLGTMLFGGGIWLISQVYHIDLNYSSVFLAWSIGALLMAWARLSFIQALLALVLLASWGYLEMFQNHRFENSAAWLVLLGIVPLAWILRSAFLLLSSIVVFYSLWMVGLIKPLDDTIAYTLFANALTFIALGVLSGRVQKLEFPNLRFVLMLPGFAMYLSFVFALTFTHFTGRIDYFDPFESSYQALYFFLPGLLALVLMLIAWLPIAKLRPRDETDGLHIILMMISFALVFSIGPGWWVPPYGLTSGMMNLIFMGHCLLFILNGSRTQRSREVAIGCLLFSVLVFARYSDLFESLLSRSLVFLVLGASLFVVGNFYSRQKARQDEAGVVT